MSPSPSLSRTRTVGYGYASSPVTGNLFSVLGERVLVGVYIPIQINRVLPSMSYDSFGVWTLVRVFLKDLTLTNCCCFVKEEVGVEVSGTQSSTLIVDCRQMVTPPLLSYPPMGGGVGTLLLLVPEFDFHPVSVVFFKGRVFVFR